MITTITRITCSNVLQSNDNFSSLTIIQMLPNMVDTYRRPERTTTENVVAYTTTKMRRLVRIH